MDATNKALDCINEILLQHTEVEMFAYARTDYDYDAKLKLRGPGLVVLKVRGVSGFYGESMSIYQMWLQVSDVRSHQHDRVSYEITNQLEERVLWRCRAVILTTGGDRIELP